MTRFTARLKSSGSSVDVVMTDCGLVKQCERGRPFRVFRSLFEFDGRTVVSDVDAKIVMPGRSRTPNLSVRLAEDHAALEAAGLDVASIEYEDAA